MIYRCDQGYLLHERASSFWASGCGWLSVKTFAGGQADYTAGGGRFVVDDSRYLVLNQATPYTIAIDTHSAVESCCVFWSPAALADAVASLCTSDDTLLADPAPRGSVPVLIERSFPAGDQLWSGTAKLRAAANAGAIEPLWLDEQLHLMLVALLRLQGRVDREIAALPPARAATRIELYRRLHLAREWADASLDRPIRLAELAAVAGMSPNHLLRGWHQLFGCTPLQYLNRGRMVRACRLLRDTDAPVADICLAVGLHSFTSFSRAFRRHTGTSPSDYRKQFRV